MSDLKHVPNVFRLNDHVLPYGEVMNPEVNRLVGTEPQFRSFVQAATYFAAKAASHSYRSFFDNPAESKTQMLDSFKQTQLAAKLAVGLPEEMREKFFSQSVATAGRDKESVELAIAGIRDKMKKYRDLGVSAVISDGREAVVAG